MKYMEDNNLKTEILDKNENFIDLLSDDKAFDFMLYNQEKAFKAIQNKKKIMIKVVNALTNKLSQNKLSRLIYVGAGTSGRIGVQDGVELIPTFGWPKNRNVYLIAGGIKALLESIENAEDDIKEAEKAVILNKISKQDVVIGLSASGNTPYTNQVLKLARKKGALTIGITNNYSTLLESNSEIHITLDTGPEVIAGSTRLTAGTAQKICLNIISSLTMINLGNVKNGQMVNMLPLNNKLKKRAQNINKILGLGSTDD